MNKPENSEKPDLGEKFKIVMQASVLEAVQPAETVSEDMPASDIIKMLCKNQVLVATKNYEVTGVVTPAGFLKTAASQKLESLNAGSFKESLPAIDPTKSLEEAVGLMKAGKSSYVAVLSKSGILGILSADGILKFAEKKLRQEKIEQEELIVTNIDEFIDLIRKGPANIKELCSKLGITEDQLDEWIEILAGQNIIKVEKRFGNLKMKDERKV